MTSSELNVFEVISGLNQRRDFCFEIKLMNVFRLCCLSKHVLCMDAKYISMVGMLCVSMVLLELLSFYLISCVHNCNLVGGVFHNLLLTSVKVCLGTIWAMRPLLRNCHYAQCIRSKLSCNKSLIFSHKTLVLSNRRPTYFCHSHRSKRQKRKAWFFFKYFIWTVIALE